MRLTREELADGCLIRVAEPRLDAAQAIQFKDKLRAVAGDQPGRVVLDMSQVDFLDSSGLGAVVAAMKLLGPDRPLELAGLTPTVAKVFRLTRMDTVFRIHHDTDSLTEGARRAG
jgi:anti-sigma B factor antagonist